MAKLRRFQAVVTNLRCETEAGNPGMHHILKGKYFMKIYSDAALLKSTLALAADDLVRGLWLGIRANKNLVLAIWPSNRNPDYVHYSILDPDTGFQDISKLAIVPYAVGSALDQQLRSYDLSCVDFAWRLTPKDAMETLRKVLHLTEGLDNVDELSKKNLSKTGERQGQISLPGIE
jgi:hypothetical protein